ncbi:MAG: hypothetical protein H6623_09005 [Bdellovibrionaceae bacterium]|nr:hypothetical protein [Pseudobdellovibrionaceae bacterium]
MSEGKSLTGFAASIGVCKDTIYEWTKKYPQFSDALKIAKTKCEAFWEEKALEGLFVDKDKRLNTSLWSFYMKCRFGWKEESEDGGHTVITLNYAVNDPKDIEDS